MQSRLPHDLSSSKDATLMWNEPPIQTDLSNQRDSKYLLFSVPLW